MSFEARTNTRPAQSQPGHVQADALKGRGSGWAIAHRFNSDLREQFDDGWGSLEQQASEEHLPPTTQIIEERAKSILSSNQQPDIHFDQSSRAAGRSRLVRPRPRRPVRAEWVSRTRSLQRLNGLRAKQKSVVVTRAPSGGYTPPPSSINTVQPELPGSTPPTTSSRA